MGQGLTKLLHNLTQALSHCREEIKVAQQLNIDHADVGILVDAEVPSKPQSPSDGSRRSDVQSST